ncbi:MAG: zinc-binding dehydrogenase [Saprospiraceae bacterium]|nr:zinc-binding dehydrogenase [Saprospiraceae bacterium]MBK8851210.1 zinc-binding dehydrogenase [Saprospiraceae bacterium]
MKALVFENIHTLPNYTDIEISPKENEVEVNISAAALNHRDVWITKGLYPGLVPGTIMGADGMGWYLGKRVVINPGLDWGHNERYQSKKFRVLGVPDHGTFAEKICIPQSYIYDAPDHLTDEEVAALPVAGVTAYRALFTRAQLMQGEHVLVTGLGGGVALMAALMAKAHGAKVFFTTGSNEKLQKGLQLGFDGGINYKEENSIEKMAEQCGHIDVIIDSTAGEGLNTLMKLCTFGSRIVLYGGSLGKINGINPQPLFWKQMDIMGSSMGSPSDFQAMLDFVAKHRLHPIVDSIYSIEAFGKAFSRMEEGSQMGKIVLSLPQ